MASSFSCCGSEHPVAVLWQIQAMDSLSEENEIRHALRDVAGITELPGGVLAAGPLAAALAAGGTAGVGGGSASLRSQPGPAAVASLVLHVRLNGIEPPIWRRFWVEETITMGRLDEVLQIVMGWQDLHLHQFITGKGLEERVFFTPPCDDGFGAPEFMARQREETRVKARTLLLEKVVLVDPRDQGLPGASTAAALHRPRMWAAPQAQARSAGSVGSRRCCCSDTSAGTCDEMLSTPPAAGG